MSEWDIWTEGYLATGMEGIPAKAQKMNAEPIEAPTFDAAVASYVAELPEESARYWRRLSDGGWVMWGCKAFPDEASARKSFG